MGEPAGRSMIPIHGSPVFPRSQRHFLTGPMVPGGENYRISTRADGEVLRLTRLLWSLSSALRRFARSKISIGRSTS